MTHTNLITSVQARIDFYEAELAVLRKTHKASSPDHLAIIINLNGRLDEARDLLPLVLATEAPEHSEGVSYA